MAAQNESASTRALAELAALDALQVARAQVAGRRAERRPHGRLGNEPVENDPHR